MDEETQGTESEEEVEAHRSRLPATDAGEADEVEAHRSKLPRNVEAGEGEGEDDDVEAHRNVFGRNAADEGDDAATLQRNKNP